MLRPLKHGHFNTWLEGQGGGHKKREGVHACGLLHSLFTAYSQIRYITFTNKIHYIHKEDTLHSQRRHVTFTKKTRYIHKEDTLHSQKRHLTFTKKTPYIHKLLTDQSRSFEHGPTQQVFSKLPRAPRPRERGRAPRPM